MHLLFWLPFLKENVARWDFQKSKVVFKNGVVIFYNDQIESVKGSHRFIDLLFINNTVVKNNIDGGDDENSVDILEELDSEEDGCPVLDSEELQAEMLKNWHYWIGKLWKMSS